MSSIPTESRIFADRYLRETRQLEKLHAGRLLPGAESWSDALVGLAERMQKVGSPIKRVAMLQGVVDCLNATDPEQVRHCGLHYRKGSRTATFVFATFSADPNPFEGVKGEDGLSVLMQRLESDRRGVALITNIHIAFISRHAIARLHERRHKALTSCDATTIFTVIGALGYLTRTSDKHVESALHLELDDILIVGASKPAAKRAGDGRDYDNTLYEVRTTLWADEVADQAARQQGQIASQVVVDWFAGRKIGAGAAVERIPTLPWRGGDYTSKLAVRR